MQQTAQQDTQEFLSYLFDSIHAEALKFGSIQSSERMDLAKEDKGWKTVTGNKKATKEVTVCVQTFFFFAIFYHSKIVKLKIARVEHQTMA
jgi:hypothetical protein